MEANVSYDTRRRMAAALAEERPNNYYLADDVLEYVNGAVVVRHPIKGDSEFWERACCG
jgi:hypothetical protein